MIRPPETDYAALYYRDLAEWLDITGYHDFHHRQMILVRHRDNRALEERRLAIEDDPEASRGYIARSQTIAPRDDDIRRVRASSAYAMPPPSGIPSRDERELSVRAHEGVPLRAPSRAAMYPPILRDERPRYADEFRASPRAMLGVLRGGSPFARMIMKINPALLENLLVLATRLRTVRPNQKNISIMKRLVHITRAFPVPVLGIQSLLTIDIHRDVSRKSVLKILRMKPLPCVKAYPRELLPVVAARHRHQHF